MKPTVYRVEKEIKEVSRRLWCNEIDIIGGRTHKWVFEEVEKDKQYLAKLKKWLEENK